MHCMWPVFALHELILRLESVHLFYQKKVFSVEKRYRLLPFSLSKKNMYDANFAGQSENENARFEIGKRL